MKKGTLIIIIVIVCIGVWMLYGYLSIRNIEEPSYTVLNSKPSRIEIRQYDAMLIAETTARGAYAQATNSGFRTVAGYIFGDNADNRSIAMTTPVMQQPDGEDGFFMRFMLPAQYSLDALPKPNNAAVTLLEVPKRTIGVISFTGFWTERKAETFTQTLRGALEQDGYTILSVPQFARYNPPWTPPWMRRNEIWMEVQL